MHPVAVGSFASFRVSVMTAPIFSFTAPSFTASSLDANGLDVYLVLPRFYQSSFDHRIYKRAQGSNGVFNPMPDGMFPAKWPHFKQRIEAMHGRSGYNWHHGCQPSERFSCAHGSTSFPIEAGWWDVIPGVQCLCHCKKRQQNSIFLIVPSRKW